MTYKLSSKSWADEVPEAPTPTGARQEVSQADGSILVTESLLVGGERVIRTSRIRRDTYTERVYPAVEDRRATWEPFGRPKIDPKAEVTSVGDPVALVLSLEGAHGTSAAAAEKMTAKSLMDLEKDLKRESQRAAVREKMEEVQSQKGRPEAEAADNAPKSTAFQARRSGEGNSMSGPKQEVCSLRISNLSEETKEEALRLLCQKIGRVSKVYVPTMIMTDAHGKQEKRGKGFAFVTFSTKREAEDAIKKLDRLPFQSSILSVEWGAK